MTRQSAVVWRMNAFFAALSAILGVVNVVQWIIHQVSAGSLRARAQNEYNRWYRVAEVADKLLAQPDKAEQAAAALRLLAEEGRLSAVTFGRESLGFVPSYEPGHDPVRIGKLSLWQKIKLGFTIK